MGKAKRIKFFDIVAAILPKTYCLRDHTGYRVTNHGRRLRKKHVKTRTKEETVREYINFLNWEVPFMEKNRTGYPSKFKLISYDDIIGRVNEYFGTNKAA